MRRNFLRTIALLAAATLAIPAPAQMDLDPPKAGSIRLTSQQYLDIGKPRRIGGMDYVDSIFYRPGEHRIAAVSHRIVDGKYKCSIQLVQADNGSRDTLVSTSVDFRTLTQRVLTADDKVTPKQFDRTMDTLETNWDMSPAAYTPHGWTQDGRYLIADYMDMDTATADHETLGKTISIDALNDPATVRDIVLDGYDLGSPYWSPDHMRVAFVAVATPPNDTAATPGAIPDTAATPVAAPPAASARTFVVYDPSTYQFTKVAGKGGLAGWVDNDKLLIHGGSHQKGKPFVSHSLKTGEEVALTENDVEVMQLAQETQPNVCPTHPELVSRFIDEPASDERDTRAVHSLWLKRISSTDVLSSVAIATAGTAQDRSTPQVAWASDGKQFAYVLGGDLYVVDVTEHQPTDEERLAAGEDLPCDEMQRIATTRMKQIGLAIIQYSQDYDEHFPPADKVDDNIYPYIKSRDAYSVGKYHWIYMPPADLAEANMQSPADTPIGRIDLPCGPVVLYGDGHVKSGDNRPNDGAAAGNDPNSGIPGDSPQ